MLKTSTVREATRQCWVEFGLDGGTDGVSGGDGGGDKAGSSDSKGADAEAASASKVEVKPIPLERVRLRKYNQYTKSAQQPFDQDLDKTCADVKLTSNAGMVWCGVCHGGWRSHFDTHAPLTPLTLPPCTMHTQR